MKYIDKSPEPINFKKWKKTWRARNDNSITLDNLYEQENMKGSQLWRVLSTPKYTSTGEKRLYSKQELKEALIEEQGYICCYCNRQISSGKVTVEHFKEKSEPRYFHLVFDYRNLLLSCDGYEKRPKPREICCNTARNKNNNQELPLSPLQIDIEEYFDFTLDGQIIGLTEEAENLIYNLGLGIEPLRQLRQKAIRAFVYQNPFDLELKFIGKEEAKKEIQNLRKLQSAKFQPFCTAIIKVLENEIINV